MKSIYVYIAVIVSVCMMAACGGGGGDDSQSPLNPGGDYGNSAKFYYQSITVTAQGGEQSMTLIDLKSAISSIGSTPSWIVISPKQYTSGSPSIKLEVEENKTSSERKCEVTIIAASGDKVSLTVTQQATNGDSGGGNPETGTSIDDPHNEQTDQPAYAPRR